MIMRDAVVEASGNFDHLEFCNVHPNLSARAYSIFASTKNATATAGIRSRDLQAGYRQFYRDPRYNQTGWNNGRGQGGVQRNGYNGYAAEQRNCSSCSGCRCIGEKGSRALLASRDTLDPKVCLAIKEKKEKLAGTDPAALRENGEKWACLASLELTEYRAFRDLRDLEEHLALMVAMVQREILGRSVLLDHTGRPVTLAHLVHQDREESPPMDPLEQKERRQVEIIACFLHRYCFQT
ncbi:hypothetical protein HPB51_020140 [Rhipicephalus microplus]|uniref:Uncharacterized protein n=1 Tax=Rhipicephalus microplus TaxID=6941 RepID=A0A9J6EI77_RHIMP|nr:hypothetical protein HPB51_020140 [Rhipicephalus microplus]